MRGLRERRIGATAERDERDVETQQRGQQIDEFVRLAAGGKRQDRVAVGDHAEIAVAGVERVEHHGRRAGASQRGSNFLADVTGLADADDDDFPPSLDRGAQELHRARECRPVEPIVQTAQLVGFQRDDAPRFAEVIHDGQS